MSSERSPRDRNPSGLDGEESEVVTVELSKRRTLNPKVELVFSSRSPVTAKICERKPTPQVGKRSQIFVGIYNWVMNTEAGLNRD